MDMAGLACIHFQGNTLAMALLTPHFPMGLGINHHHTTLLSHRRNKMQSLKNVCANLVSNLCFIILLY